MAKIPLVLPTGITIGREGQDANARLVNAYAEDVGAEGKSRFAVYASPGLTRFDDASYTGTSRGMIELNSDALVAFLGNQVVQFDQGGVDSVLGTLVGSGRLHLARNRASTPEIGIVTGVGQYYILSGGSINQINDSDLPSPNSICYLKGVFVYGIEDGRIFCSDVEDGTSIQADAFGTAHSDSSDLRTVVSHAGFLYVFKAKGAEIWQSDPSLASENFFFSPVQQDIDIGCLAPFSVAELARGLAWVDDDGVVRYGRDGAAQRISNHTVEREIASLSHSQRQAIEGFKYVFHGHEIYVLTSASWTYEYDATTGKWYQRKSYGLSRWQATGCEAFNGSYIVGNVTDGKLYMIDPDKYGEGDENHVMEIWCPQSHRFPDRMVADSVYLDVIGGVGLSSGGEHATDPQIMIDYSDDGGATFNGEREEPLGQIGERKKRVKADKWGLVEEQGRIWRFRASAPVLRGVLQAHAAVRPLP